MPKNEETETNEYKGYALFNDIDDAELRAANRGTVLANIVENNNRKGKLSHSSAATVIGYFASIPAGERKPAVAECEARLIERGLVVDGIRMD